MSDNNIPQKDVTNNVLDNSLDKCLNKPFEIPHYKSISSGFPDVNENKRPIATVKNLAFLVKWYGISIAYDELLKAQIIKFNNAADLGNPDLRDNSNVAYIKSLLALNHLPSSMLDLLPVLFHRSTINPVMDWIESKPWDEIDRLAELYDTLTIDTSTDTDDELYHEDHERYRELALRTWMVQCVAAADGGERSPHPDKTEKYELVFILQGDQGIQKTQWFRRLVPKKLDAYIIDGAHLDPADKDTVKNCISSWICELGELDSTFKKADISRLKAFMSKKEDVIRLPYDRCNSTFKRRTSFCGSVNPPEFLTDTTGSRRFLPLKVSACDSHHTLDMQQVWAQVLTYYLAGYQWWVCGELDRLIVTRHEAHAETIPTNELIQYVFDVFAIERGPTHKFYSATNILIESGIKEPKSGQASLANQFLQKMGFKKKKIDGNRGYWLRKIIK